MSKDCYYFPHDSNAKDDPKCVLLIEQLGMEGYGIYWMLVEVLRDQPDYTYPIALIPALARRYNTTCEKVKAVVAGYDLFTIKDDRIFFSDSLNRRMARLEETRVKRSNAGKIGNAARWGESQTDRIVIANGSHCDRNSSLTNKNRTNKNKEKKLSNESKESADKPRTVASKRPAFVAPSLETLQSYFPTIGGTTQDAEAFFDHFEANGWKVSGKTPMKNWQAAARNWVRRKAEFSNTTAKTTTHETTRKYNDL